MAFLEVKFFSDVLGMCMSMNVILPQNATEPYPTLYLLHGMSDDHSTWSRQTSIERYAEYEGIAVVMPTTYLGWYTDMKLGGKYRTFVGEELPKICRSFFPMMSHKREDTYLAGNSMGGYGSAAIALTYPDTFSIAAPLSGAFDPKWLYHPDNPKDTYFNDIFGDIKDFDGSANDLWHLAKTVKEAGGNVPKFFIWCGTEDFLFSVNTAFRDHLMSLGYDLTYTQTPGNHSWYYWDREIQSVLRYIKEYRKMRKEI